MGVVEKNSVALDIMKALGVDLPNVQYLDLEIRPESIVSINIEYYPTKEQVKTLIPLLKKYHLVEKEKELEVVIQGQDIIGSEG